MLSVSILCCLCANLTSSTGWSVATPRPSHALLQARLDERVEIAVEDPLRIADFDVGAQVLDPALVEHVAADLVTPSDVGLGVLELLLGCHADPHLVLVEARAQHLPGFVAVAVLRTIVLAL